MGLNFLKSQDMFGAPVTLNLRKEGNTVKTIQGGVCSILINLCLIYFLQDRARKVINRAQTNFGYHKTITDLDETGELSMGDNGMLLILTKMGKNGAIQPVDINLNQQALITPFEITQTTIDEDGNELDPV